MADSPDPILLIAIAVIVVILLLSLGVFISCHKRHRAATLASQSRVKSFELKKHEPQLKPITVPQATKVMSRNALNELAANPTDTGNVN